MSIIKKTKILSDLLTENYELIPIVNRFGIKLGVGEKTIEDICCENNLNTDFILEILNIYVDENYESDTDHHKFEVSLIGNYLNETIANYIKAFVPNIEKHLNAFISISGGESKDLKLLNDIFQQFKTELSEHLEQGLGLTNDYPNELLHDLKNIMIRYISPNYNQNLGYAVIFSISSLEKDIMLHNRIKNKMLDSKMQLLTNDDDGVGESPAKKGKKKNKTFDLTKRETEILCFVVEGLTNREIASKANISLNTVLTHRKNIISKTGIKTVSGLTFYCISNGLIKPEMHL